jgi:hypothetical protein
VRDSGRWRPVQDSNLRRLREGQPSYRWTNGPVQLRRSKGGRTSCACRRSLDDRCGAGDLFTCQGAVSARRTTPRVNRSGLVAFVPAPVRGTARTSTSPAQIWNFLASGACCLLELHRPHRPENRKSRLPEGGGSRTVTDLSRSYSLVREALLGKEMAARHLPGAGMHCDARRRLGSTPVDPPEGPAPCHVVTSHAA